MINSNAHETRMAIAVSMSFKCIRILNPVSIGIISTFHILYKRSNEKGKNFTCRWIWRNFCLIITNNIFLIIWDTKRHCVRLYLRLSVHWHKTISIRLYVRLETNSGYHYINRRNIWLRSVSLFGFPFVLNLYLVIVISSERFDVNTWDLVYRLLLS